MSTIHPSGVTSWRAQNPASVRISAVVLALMGLSLLNNTNHLVLKSIGLCSLGGVVLISGWIALPAVAVASNAWVICCWGSLFVVYSTSLFFNLTFAGFWAYLQLLAVIAIFGWSLGIPSNETLRKELFLPSKMILIFAIMAILSCLRGSLDQAITNPNTAAEAVMCIVFIEWYRHAIVKTKLHPVDFLTVIAALAIMFYANARSCWLGLAVFFATYYGWPLISKTRRIYWSVFAIICSGIFTVTWVLVHDFQSIKYLDELQELSWKYFEKNVDTRSGEWVTVAEGIGDKPWTGWGLDAQPRILHQTEDGLSSHNQYLELGLRAGLPGILGITLAFTTIWASYWGGRKLKEIRVCGAILLSIMVQQTFEVNLLQSGLCMGLIWWCLLGLGTGHSLRFQRQTQRQSFGGLPTSIK